MKSMKNNPINFFMAGIIQGSHQDQAIQPQNYRDEIRAILTSEFPDCTVFCPFEKHPESAEYDDPLAESVFRKNVNIAANSDVIIVFLPQASMGSSIEMWEAQKNNVPIIAITPMKENWVVRILADRICASIADFRIFIAEGGLLQVLNKKNKLE